MTSPKPVGGEDRQKAADRQQLGKQLHETLRQWYELVENRQLLAEPFESLEESEREILGKCAAQLQQAFTKNHSQAIEKLQKQITDYQKVAFTRSQELIRISLFGTHRQKSEEMAATAAYLLAIARPAVFPDENSLDEIPF